MKLRTMLLPTGEFVYIASECKTLPDPAAVDAVRDFVSNSGAAAALFLTETVEVEDALVDENAIPALRNLVNLADLLNDRVQQGVVEISPEDQKVIDAIELGQDFSPAGLVIRNAAGEETARIGADGDVASVSLPPKKPLQRGQRVVITGPSVMHPDESRVGEHGLVIATGPRDGELLVQIDRNKKNGDPKDGVRWYFLPSSLEREKFCGCYMDTEPRRDRTLCETCPFSAS